MAERMRIAKFVLNIQLPIFEGFSLHSSMLIHWKTC